MHDIKITSRKFKLSSANKSYILEKINKHGELLQDATLIEVEVSQDSSKREKNIKLQINVNLPRAFIKVEEKGQDLNALVDILESTLFRRLKRYHDLYNKWQGKKKWKTARTPKNLELDQLESYKDYEPFISKRTIYEDDSPKHPAEAIEAMELLGSSSFLFRNIENNKHSMIYKNENGDYILVEPPDK